MLTICVEAGMGFDAATAQVARAHWRAAGRRARPVAAGDADRQIAQPGPAVDGGPGREQAKEMRVRRRQRVEGRAQQVPVEIVVPRILRLFPALLIIVVGPGIIEIRQTVSHHL